MMSTLAATPQLPLSPLASFPLPGPTSSDALNQLVRLAARIVKAEGSFLLLNCEGHLKAVHSFGLTGLPDTPEWDLLQALDLVTENGI